MVATNTFSMPKRGMQRGERHHERRRGAVGVGEDRAAPPALAPLGVDEAEVPRVDLGHDQRHVGIHAVDPRVGDDDAPRRARTPARCRPPPRRRAPRTRRARRVAGRNAAPPCRRCGWGSGRGLAPANHLAVAPAGALPRRGHGDELEPGMVGQEADELLPDRSGGAEHGDGNAGGHARPAARRSRASFS